VKRKTRRNNERVESKEKLQKDGGERKKRETFESD
jgi:hypothetical protein